MWWMAAYGVIIFGRFALGVYAVNSRTELTSHRYSTDVMFYP